ncbi:MAG: ATP-binding cassette domain-containing protein [Pseudomonadota bacterium]
MKRRSLLGAALAATVVAASTPVMAQSGALAGLDLSVREGWTYSFLGPTGAGKTTTISIITDLVGISIGTEDAAIVDLGGGEIYVNDRGNYIGLGAQMAQARKQMGALGQVAGGAAAPASTGDAELDAYYQGFPAAMVPSLRDQMSKLPKAQQIQTLAMLRQQMGLPAVQAGGAGSAAKATRSDGGFGPTGRTDTIDGIAVREVNAGQDTVWVADPATIDGGAEFVDQMSATGALFRKIMDGFDQPDESILNIDRLGGFPIRIITVDGDVINYAGSMVGPVDMLQQTRGN